METSNVSQNRIRTEKSGVSLNKRYYVYILQSKKDQGLYIGYTTNLKERLASHLCGNVVSTKGRLPLQLIHYEYFVHIRDAKAREVYLKSGHGRTQLKQFLKNTLLVHNEIST
ncbi:MAG: GIY-YIG nuclease family protein [bacterium]